MYNSRYLALLVSLSRAAQARAQVTWRVTFQRDQKFSIGIVIATHKDQSISENLRGSVSISKGLRRTEGH